MKKHRAKFFSLIFLFFIGEQGFPVQASFSSSPSGSGVVAAQSETDQILMQIENQMQSLVAGQSQLQSSFQSYTQFSLQTAYPSIPFPGWKDISLAKLFILSSPNFTGFIKELSNFDLAHFSVDESVTQRKGFISNLAFNFQSSLPDSGVGDEINNYEKVMNEQGNQMTEVQALRFANQLSLLNAKASYIQYQQSQRLESLLLAQIYLQVQPQLTLEVKSK